MDGESKFRYIWVSVGFFILAILVGYLFLVFPRFLSDREAEVKESNEVEITIPEGLNIRQIGNIFEKENFFSSEMFIRFAEKEEGYLFPDTYRFYKTASPEDVVAKMKQNFDKKITPDIMSELARQKKSLKELVIMASILEEEVKTTEDRKIVAGILWKRLEKGIGLNVDAALTYVLSKTSSELTEKDLRLDSPYNTYRYRGLIPTPISNPGLDAILAALYPTTTKYYYYLSDSEGKTHYAVTLDEHAINKKKFIR